MRNQWFVSANDATVDDPDALLAGPPWSVLADFHNCKQRMVYYKCRHPTTFPRTVGDNALIFGRRAPNSPRGAFSCARSAYPFFNCFSSSEKNQTRTKKSFQFFLSLLKPDFLFLQSPQMILVISALNIPIHNSVEPMPMKTWFERFIC